MILGKNLSKLIFGSPETEYVKTASQGFDAVKISDGLTKVASMPYNPSTYSSLIGMVKIASQCINSLNDELQSSKNSISEFEKKAEIRVIIDDLIENGLTDEYDVEDKIESLLEKSASELATVKEAISLSSDVRLGNLFDGMDKTSSIKVGNKKEMFEGMF